MVSYATCPTFAECITALAQPGSTEEELDVSALLTDVERYHAASNDESDEAGRWGICTGCGEYWPCPTWVFCDALALQLISRACDRVWAHAVSVLYPDRTITDDTPLV